MSETIADPFRKQSVAQFESSQCSVTAPPRASSLTEQFRILKQALQRPVAFERRQYGRIALPLVLRVTPLDQTGQPLQHLAIQVVGKDISPRGISFFHELPLPHRRAIVDFEHPDVGRFSFEVDITWCRFSSPGWYQSGGRLIRTFSRAETPHFVA
jgi:hypothetical protein